MNRISNDYKIVFAIWKYSYEKFDNLLKDFKKEVNDK